MASIESLPVELLQPIFINSDHNIALLQASPRISARLSSEYIYHSSCNHYLTGIREEQDRAQQSQAQTYIFASKWMTWAFFKSWIMRAFGPNRCLCNMNANRSFDPQWPPNFEDATTMFFSRSHLPKLAFVKARIPKKLLRGPWTRDKIQFLRFLLWITSMTVDWRDSEAREAAVEGRKQAMLERNLEAVELFNHNRRLGRVADISMIRFAIMDAGCDRSIVYDTILTASTLRSNKSWDCTELDEWCTAQISKGNSKANWVLTKLTELRDDDPISPETGTYNGDTDDILIVRHTKWNEVKKKTFLSIYSHISHHLHTSSPV
jgi:hypothetical protein